MAVVKFYEKPGCRNNTRQKAMLSDSGHSVVARDILAEPWTPETLRPFFGAMPLAAWFNPAAPRVKSGEIDPAALDEVSALAMMVAEPLLIRRPLMDVAGEKRAGFDVAEVTAWIGLAAAAPLSETCPNGSAPCVEPH